MYLSVLWIEPTSSVFFAEYITHWAIVADKYGNHNVLLCIITVSMSFLEVRFRNKCKTILMVILRWPVSSMGVCSGYCLHIDVIGPMTGA